MLLVIFRNNKEKAFEISDLGTGQRTILYIFDTKYLLFCLAMPNFRECVLNRRNCSIHGAFLGRGMLERVCA